MQSLKEFIKENLIDKNGYLPRCGVKHFMKRKWKEEYEEILRQSSFLSDIREFIVF